MKIQTKIWLLTALVLLVLLGVTSAVRYRQIQENITLNLLEGAQTVRGILMATRRVQHMQFLASGLPVNEKTIGFLPAHSLSRIAKDFPNWAKSGLYFNAVSDRPRNPGNLADASELQAMDWFRAHPKDENRAVEIKGADGQAYFHFAAPLYIEAYCLICHGERAAAPPSIRELYSEAYGYKLGDLRGVLSIKIPMARQQELAWALWRNEMLVNVAGFLVLFLVLGVSLNRLVIRRLARLEKTAGALAKGDYSRRSLQDGDDEVSSLARAIDRMAEAVQLRDNELLGRERKISAILAAAPVGVGLTMDHAVGDSVNRVITEANDSLCKLLDYSREEIIGLSTRELYETPAAGALAHQIREEQIAASGICVQEAVWKKKDGALLDILLTISPLVPNDVSQGVVFSALDITERKKYEKKVLASKAELEAQVAARTADLSAALETARLADLAKDAFLANVSHELRTPLNAVIGMSGLARRTSTEPQQQDQLDKVIGAGKTLASLIDDLLDLSKIVAGHLEFESVDFSLRGVVQRCSSVISYRAAEKGLKLVDKVSDNVPDVLRGDPLRLEQILLNLLSNAVKFTAAGQVEIRVGLQSLDASRIGLAIEVEDSGVGMSEAEMAHLFKPFSQADSSMSRKYGGSGLGLAICKKLAEMMGGEISVRSHPGQGSVFFCSLYFSPGDAAQIAAPETLVGHEAVHYHDAQVLVVEDQPLNREIAEALLKLVGIEVRMAADGQEALDVLKAGGPAAFDLVLMDIQMPVMDGLAATRELRGMPGFESLPVIAMTAHTMTHEKELSVRAGMNDHIGKPFDNASFYRTLARWMPESRQQRVPESPVLADAAVPVAAFSFPAIQGIDTQAAIERFIGNEDRYRHWLLAFLEEGPEAVVQIHQALATGSTEAARQAAHAFKGRVGMLGMTGLHVIASTLEAALKQGHPIEGLLDKLAQSVTQTCAQIHSALGEQQATPVLLAPLPDQAPEAVVQVLGLLDASDGSSAAAILQCLEELKGSDWAPRLQQALIEVQNFDFTAAANTLSADKMEPLLQPVATGKNPGRQDGSA